MKSLRELSTNKVSLKDAASACIPESIREDVAARKIQAAYAYRRYIKNLIELYEIGEMDMITVPKQLYEDFFYKIIVSDYSSDQWLEFYNKNNTKILYLEVQIKIIKKCYNGEDELSLVYYLQGDVFDTKVHYINMYLQDFEFLFNAMPELNQQYLTMKSVLIFNKNRNSLVK